SSQARRARGLPSSIRKPKLIRGKKPGGLAALPGNDRRRCGLAYSTRTHANAATRRHEPAGFFLDRIWGVVEHELLGRQDVRRSQGRFHWAMPRGLGMQLRRALMPPALDQAKVARLAELAAAIDGANPGQWENALAEFNREAGTTLTFADFQGI